MLYLAIYTDSTAPTPRAAKSDNFVDSKNANILVIERDSVGLCAGNGESREDDSEGRKNASEARGHDVMSKAVKRGCSRREERWK